MAYDVNNIINIVTRISPSGLGFANFALATGFAPASELPGGFDTDTYRDYSSLTALSVDFASGTKTHDMASKWLGGVPSSNSIRIYGVDAGDANWGVTLDKARNVTWWFWSFFTDTVYADVTGDVLEIAQWCNNNESFFINCQTGSSAIAIRDPSVTTDVSTVLTTLGYRYAATFAHATDAYAGIALCKWFAAVNYSAANSTITGEFKKLSGVAAETLTDTAYGAMRAATKKCQFYTVVELQGSVDNGRVINSFTHSTFGEYMDDVINLAAFVNNLKVALYNSIANNTTKTGQDIPGQATLIGDARAVCDQYVVNNYLGPRNYIDPDDGVEKFTAGYEILTRPEDILDLSEPDRDARKSAPLRIRIFRTGAIHAVDVSVDVF